MHNLLRNSIYLMGLDYCYVIINIKTQPGGSKSAVQPDCFLPRGLSLYVYRQVKSILI